MTDPGITPLAEPKTVNLAAIERELNLLWRSATENGIPHPVLRACALNLLVYLKGNEDLHAVTEVIGRLTVQHPNRAIVLVAEPDRQPAELTSWVSAQCHLSRTGGKQVCCEQIMMNASGDQIPHLPSAAIPLLLADLPVYLWWTDAGGIGNDPFRKLAGVASRVIIDSAQFRHPKAQFGQLLSFLAENGPQPALGDLNWSRLLSWRELIAQFFDSVSSLAKLAQIDRMFIAYRGRDRKVSTIPAQPLLLAGWFMSRLGWKPLPTRHRVNGLSHFLTLEKDKAEFELEVRMVEEERMNSGDVFEVRLFDSRDSQMEFRLHRSAIHEPAQSHEIFKIVVQEGGNAPIGREVTLRPLDNGHLLADQLSLQGHDRVFDEACKTAAELTSW